MTLTHRTTRVGGSIHGYLLAQDRPCPVACLRATPAKLKF